MNPPLLSIVIPTYNRADFIRDCLDSIVSQFDDEANGARVGDQMEIVISDNASTDGTAEVVKEYMGTYPNITYSRNVENLGFDRNFLNVIAHAKGTYCLSIGDDDAFLEKSFSLILKKLHNSAIPFYGLNSWGYDHTLTSPVLPHTALSISKDIRYEKLSEYVRSIKKLTNIVGGFVGLSHLFLREPWNAYPDKERYVGTLAIHMHVLLSIFKDRPYMLLATPLIKTRSSNIRWNVFAGLETMQGRIAATIKTADWMRKNFNLPISDTRMYMYFYIREYWFTGKEIMKKRLSDIGLGYIITLYRKLR